MEKNKAEYEIYKLHRQAGKENEAKLLQRGMQHSIYLVARQGFLLCSARSWRRILLFFVIENADCLVRK